MADIAVKVIDPGGYQFAQLLDEQQPVRRLIPILVERLGLPAELNYQLIPAATNRPLKVDSSLAGAGVQPGAELFVQPVRDSLLQALLDKLYKEARSFVIDKLWDLAKERLSTILRLDSTYPDPANLRGKIPGNNRFDQPSAGPAPAHPPPLPPMVQPVSPAPQQATSAAGCWVVVIIVAVAATVYFKPWELLDKNKKGPNLPGRVHGPGGQNPTNGAPPQLGTGDVQVTLRWQNNADLDLRVVTPVVEGNGQREQIWYKNRENTRSGGRLDVDANGGCGNLVPQPVENVFWPQGKAPRGEYQVFVDYFTECNKSGPTNYELTVRVNGQVQEQVNSFVSRAGEKKLAVTFRY